MQSYLELVLLGLSRRAGVEEIDSENLMRGMALAWMSEASALRYCRGVYLSIYLESKPTQGAQACCSHGVRCAVGCPA